MKKFLSLILALVMVMSLSVTAFAEGEQSGTTTVTANIPNAATPSYTIHVPASMTLEYGNTDRQLIGGAYVTDVTDVQDGDWIALDSPYTMLINVEDSSDTLDWSLSLYYGAFYSVRPNDGSAGIVNMIYRNGVYGTINYYAQVSDWSGATPGATYQAVITFQFYIE